MRLLLYFAATSLFSARGFVFSRRNPRSNNVRQAEPSKDEVEDDISVWHGWDSSKHATFMEHYWQRRPLLVRGAFPDLFEQPVVTPTQLCALACDDDTSCSGWSSRVVRKQIGPCATGPSPKPTLTP